MFVGWGGATDGTGAIEEHVEEMLSETSLSTLVGGVPAILDTRSWPGAVERLVADGYHPDEECAQRDDALRFELSPQALLTLAVSCYSEN